MTEEQRKIRKFYRDLQGDKSDTVGTWFGAGFLVVLMLIVCGVPVQEMASEWKEDGVVCLMILLPGPLAGLLYLRPYTIVSEMVYTNRAKNVRIMDKLKYLPVDFKEIRKLKVSRLFLFFAKILPLALGIQFLTGMISYGAITWENVVYVLAIAFVLPIAVNLPMVLMENTPV